MNSYLRQWVDHRVRATGRLVLPPAPHTCGLCRWAADFADELSTDLPIDMRWCGEACDEHADTHGARLARNGIADVRKLAGRPDDEAPPITHECRGSAARAAHHDAVLRVLSEDTTAARCQMEDLADSALAGVSAILVEVGHAVSSDWAATLLRMAPRNCELHFASVYCGTRQRYRQFAVDAELAFPARVLVDELVMSTADVRSGLFLLGASRMRLTFAALASAPGDAPPAVYFLHPDGTRSGGVWCRCGVDGQAVRWVTDPAADVCGVAFADDAGAALAA